MSPIYQSISYLPDALYVIKMITEVISPIENKITFCFKLHMEEKPCTFDLRFAALRS